MMWFVIGFVGAVCGAFAWLIGRVLSLDAAVSDLLSAAKHANQRVDELGDQATKNARSVADLKLNVEQRFAVLEQPKPKSEDARWITAKEVAIPGRRKERA